MCAERCPQGCEPVQGTPPPPGWGVPEYVFERMKLIILPVAVFFGLYAFVIYSARKSRRETEQQIREIQEMTKQRLERSAEF